MNKGIDFQYTGSCRSSNWTFSDYEPSQLRNGIPGGIALDEGVGVPIRVVVEVVELTLDKALVVGCLTHPKAQMAR